MNEQSPQTGIGRWTRHEQFAPTAIMLSATLLLVAWWYFGNVATEHCWASQQWHPSDAQASQQWHPSDAQASQQWHPWLMQFERPAFAAGVYGMLATFALLGVVPGLVVVAVLRGRLSDYGLQLGDRLRTFRSAAISVPFFVLAGYIASGDPVMQHAYPLNSGVTASAGSFAMHVLTYLLFYLGWEFMFRGYLLFGLADRYGVAAALLIQVMASTLIHVGKPPMETFLAVPAGLYWGWIALRTRSIVSSWMQHAALGITLDAMLIF